MLTNSLFLAVCLVAFWGIMVLAVTTVMVATTVAEITFTLLLDWSDNRGEALARYRHVASDTTWRDAVPYALAMLTAIGGMAVAHGLLPYTTF